MLVSVLEFVERFGASTVTLYNELDQIDDLEKVAEDHYRRNEYDEASETFDEVHLAWNELNTKAIKLKDNALAWIYLIEWLVVSGASMVTGLVVWSLMIRRRYYRGVRTTRFS